MWKWYQTCTNVIVCAGTPATMALKQATSTVPIVFAIVTEPAAQGIVESLAHPGGGELRQGLSIEVGTRCSRWYGWNNSLSAERIIGQKG
jgi:hypothetical protein